MSKIANNTLVYVYVVSYEHIIEITIARMMCVMVIEAAVHLVMANWIAWPTIGLVVQKKCFFHEKKQVKHMISVGQLTGQLWTTYALNLS